MGEHFSPTRRFRANMGFSRQSRRVSVIFFLALHPIDMKSTNLEDAAAAQTLADEEIARRVLSGEVGLYELLMRRHNQLVYRSVRSLIRDETEAEDVMQHAYVAAYEALGSFRGGSMFSTWLVRIAMNEALTRLRRATKFTVLEGGRSQEEIVAEQTTDTSPEDVAERRQMLGILERAIDNLPDIYRSVVMLRDVEGLSTAEAAQILDTSEDVMKTRLHRAKALLRERLVALGEAHVGSAFPFEAPRCNRVVQTVMGRIANV